MTGTDPAILFRSEALEVRAFLGRSPGLCFVVFDPMVDDLSLGRTAFGETFLAAHGIDAIHVLAARNAWYQETDLPAALDIVRAAARDYARVVAYGSSMGGYAALRFSDRVGAHAVLALSPQYSMQQEYGRQERRWNYLRDIPWLHEAPGQPLPPVAEVLVIADRKGMDRVHADAIARDLPQTTQLLIPQGGHPAATVLAETGLLSATILSAARGPIDPRGVLASLRRERHRSAQYLFNLARRQPSARLRLKGRLAATALSRRPDDAALLSYAGVLEDLQGHRDAALALHARAARTGYGLARLRYALSLMRAGLTDEAAVAAQDAMTGLPPAAIPFELIAVAEARSAPATALDALLRLPQIKSLSPAFAVLSALAGPAPLRWLLARSGAAFAPRLVRAVLSDRRFMAHHLWISDWD